MEILLNLDTYLASAVKEYGILVYVILFAIIFLETGLVVMPFLPGDSLIFVAGTLAAAGLLDVAALFAMMTVAAIAGDTVNYRIGHHVGRSKIRFVKKEYIDKSSKFYERHGKKTIVIARFIPIIRTFAPFIAGVAKMDYKHFVSYNVIGGIAWVLAFLAAGYLFGNVDIVKDNLSLVIIVIIIVTLTMPIAEFVRHKSLK